MKRRAGNIDDFRFHPSASDFDGATYGTRADLTGIADGKQFIFSAWFRIDSGDGTTRRIFNIDNGTTNYVQIALTTGNKIMCLVRNAAGTSLVNQTGATNLLAGATWRHVLISGDMAVASSFYIYLNDVVEINGVTPTNDTIKFTGGNTRVATNTVNNNIYPGCLSELFFHTSYLDLSNVANRRKFISATGRPVPLGDGSVPLGVAPLLYAPNGNPAVNRGTGGNFTITGTVTNCSSRP